MKSHFKLWQMAIGHRLKFFTLINQKIREVKKGMTNGHWSLFKISFHVKNLWNEMMQFLRQIRPFRGGLKGKQWYLCSPHSWPMELGHHSWPQKASIVALMLRIRNYNGFKGSLVVTNFHWSLVRTTQMLHSIIIFKLRWRSWTQWTSVSLLKANFRSGQEIWSVEVCHLCLGSFGNISRHF